MRSSVLSRCLLAASFGVGTTAAAQSTEPTSGHAGHAGMQGMAMSDMPAMPVAGAGASSALLTGPLGSRSATGTATVEGRTVRVAWSGDQPGSTRPWYVHRGACGRDEGMVGSPGAYRPIVADARGTGTGTATLPEPLAASGAYYVAVHSGVAGSPSDVVACGALGSGARGGQMSQMAAMPGMSTGDGQSAGHDMSGHDMAAMDHATMNMPGMAMPGMSSARGEADAAPMGPSMLRGASPAAGAAGTSTRAMMADHMRMMADHMRMMADHMAMMARASAEEGAMAMPTGGDQPRRKETTAGQPARRSPSTMGGRTSEAGGHAGMNMPGMSMSGTAAPARRAAPAPAPKRPAATPARKSAPPAKQDSMPGMDHSKMQMPGMDHGQMPGMGKP